MRAAIGVVALLQGLAMFDIAPPMSLSRLVAIGLLALAYYLAYTAPIRDTGAD